MLNNCRSIFTFLIGVLILVSIANEADAAVAKKRGGKGAFAGGAFSIGLGVATTTAEQTGINGLINAAKLSTNSTASTLSSATEWVGAFTFRFANNYVALQLRPTLFSQSSSGSGTDGSHSYSLDGYTLFPLVRIIPLSNDLIDFYIQGGLGYGKLNGSIKNGANRADFNGSGFGMQMGLGAEFCFVPDHCFNIEGNYRYLPLVRNIVTSGAGLPTGTSQAATDRELEDLNGNDVATTFSGVSGILGYTYNF